MKWPNSLVFSLRDEAARAAGCANGREECLHRSVSRRKKQARRAQTHKQRQSWPERKLGRAGKDLLSIRAPTLLTHNTNALAKYSFERTTARATHTTARADADPTNLDRHCEAQAKREEERESASWLATSTPISPQCPRAHAARRQPVRPAAANGRRGGASTRLCARSQQWLCHKANQRRDARRARPVIRSVETGDCESDGSKRREKDSKRTTQREREREEKAET